MAGLLALAAKARSAPAPTSARPPPSSISTSISPRSSKRGASPSFPASAAGIAAMIAELQRTGRSKALDALRGRVPPGALSLGRIPGLGLDKIRALHATLGVETIAELAKACEEGRVRRVKGMGEKTERRLLDRIRALEGPS